MQLALLIIVFLFSLLFPACTRAYEDFIPPAADVPALTELPAKLKKSHLKILPTEKTLLAERVVWFGLYYDGKRITDELKWESSDTEILELFYIYKKEGLYAAGFCRVPKKVTVRATYKSITVKKTFKIRPANKECSLKILLPERQEFLQGEKIDFTIMYDDENVSNKVKVLNTQIPGKSNPVHTLNQAKQNKKVLFCNLPGTTTHVFAMYNDDAVFRTVTISDEAPPMRIQIPDGAVFRPRRHIQLTAWLGDQDITESAEWEVFPVENRSGISAAVMTGKKGEILCKVNGMIFALARYGEHTAFVTIDVVE